MKKKNLFIRFLNWIKTRGIGFWTLIVITGICALSVYLYNQKNTHEDLTITELVQKISSGKVDRIVVANSTMYAIRTGEERESYRTSVEEKMTAAQMLRSYGLTDVEFKKLSIKIEGYRFNFETFMSFLQMGILILFMGTFLLFNLKPAFLSSAVGKKANTLSSEVKTKFDDIAGNAAAKKELSEIVEFLRDPDKFSKLGAVIPTGALLKGPPGTGKTLLARAVAGETGVPFYYISGSEFVELYVGVGAARVRDIFNKAKKSSPSIIFIDEIDAIGQQRQTKGTNSEDDRTLNQLLTEMDGFDNNTKVIVIGATNNPDKLDTALLRRLERQIYVNLPDAKDRLAILSIMVVGKPMADNVNLEAVARRTQGLSGDALGSLVNEAAIRAAQSGQTTIKQDDLLLSIEKVLLGSADRRIVSDEEKKIIAYHEAGHAVITKMISSNSDVQKVTIESQGNRGGFVMNAAVEENILHSYEELISQMAIAFGGYVSEKHFIGNTTTGASDDLRKINMIAYSMVTKYGMGKRFGCLIEEEGMFNSEKYWQLINDDIRDIVTEALTKTEGLVKENSEFIEAIKQVLLEKETIEQEEFSEIALRFKRS